METLAGQRVVQVVVLETLVGPHTQSAALVLVQVQLGLICRQLGPLRTLVAHLQKAPPQPGEAQAA